MVVMKKLLMLIKAIKEMFRTDADGNETNIYATRETGIISPNTDYQLKQNGNMLL